MSLDNNSITKYCDGATMIHHSIAKKQGPKEGNSVRRVTRLAACLTAVSTLGAGLIMPITAVADDATPAVQTTTTSANVRAAANTATADPIASFDFNSDRTMVHSPVLRVTLRPPCKARWISSTER